MKRTALLFLLLPILLQAQATSQRRIPLRKEHRDSAKVVTQNIVRIHDTTTVILTVHDSATLIDTISRTDTISRRRWAVIPIPLLLCRWFGWGCRMSTNVAFVHDTTTIAGTHEDTITIRLPGLVLTDTLFVQGKTDSLFFVKFMTDTLYRTVEDTITRYLPGDTVRVLVPFAVVDTICPYVQPPVTSTPEPAAWLLVITGICVLGAVRRQMKVGSNV